MKTTYAQFLEDCRTKTALEIWTKQPYFCIEEIVPKDVFLARGQKSIELFQPRAILSLIEVRILANAGITINNWKWNGLFQYRGWRPINYYTEKAISYSQHVLFNAFDYDVKGVTAEDFRKYLITWKKEGKLQYLTGIEAGVSWVHNDYRLTNRLDENGLFIFKAT